MNSNMLMHSLHRVPRWTLTVLVAAAIAWLTLKPAPPEPPQHPVIVWLANHGADKAVHAIMFGALAWMLAFDWQGRRRTVSAAVCAASAVIATLAGALIEVLQREMQLGRSYDNMDIVADALGAIIGVLLVRLMTLNLHAR